MYYNLLNPRDSGFEDFKLWYYTPSIAAAVIFIILFLGLTGYHVFLLSKRRTWFCIPFVIGGFFENIGYIARALARNKKDSVAIYSTQSITLLLAPILFAASIYMILGRIVRLVHGEKYSLIRVNWLTKIFVGGDIFCFMMQGAGGGLLASANTKASVDTGNNIILGGLILQIIIFLFFLVVAMIFQSRLSKHPTLESLEGPIGSSIAGASGRLGQLTWKKLMYGLYATSILITVRNLFRVIEYGMGWDSYLLTHEWALYVFDGLLMAGVLAICVIWYDPKIAKGNKKSMASGRIHQLSSTEEGSATTNLNKTGAVDSQWRGQWS